MLNPRKLIRRLIEQARDEQNRAMWKNFSSSLALLAVAMLAALYSSSAARDGRLIASATSATLALGIAVWVAIRFVPRLASNVEWDWLPFLAQYQITREGWIYFGAVIVVVFAAINTNNNLLYMVLSALMAVLLLSGFLSGVNFRWLKVNLRIPPHCFAGESFPLSLQIQNQKALFASFSLSIEQTKKSGLDFQSFYFTCVRAQSQTYQMGVGILPARGRYQVGKLKILSRYPFGFFLKGKDYAVDAECICYPQIIPQDQLSLSTKDILGSNQRFDRGLGSDLYMIRNYLPSDSVRHIHWKASAKTATLKTREFAAEDSRRVTLYLDRFANQTESKAFEKLVSHAASLAFHFTREGIDVELITDDWASDVGSTEKHLKSILEYLALVQRSEFRNPVPAELNSSAVVLAVR